MSLDLTELTIGTVIAIKITTMITPMRTFIFISLSHLVNELVAKWTMGILTFDVGYSWRPV